MGPRRAGEVSAVYAAIAEAVDHSGTGMVSQANVRVLMSRTVVVVAVRGVVMSVDGSRVGNAKSDGQRRLTFRGKAVVVRVHSLP
jgi:hypothetical protein